MIRSINPISLIYSGGTIITVRGFGFLNRTGIEGLTCKFADGEPFRAIY